jgi:glutaredoxin
MAKAFFQEHNVAYQEKDVAVDEQARNEMLEKSGQMGVPVIDIDGNIVVGFDKKQISQLIGVN